MLNLNAHLGRYLPVMRGFWPLERIPVQFSNPNTLILNMDDSVHQSNIITSQISNTTYFYNTLIWQHTLTAGRRGVQTCPRTANTLPPLNHNFLIIHPAACLYATFKHVFLHFDINRISFSYVKVDSVLFSMSSSQWTLWLLLIKVAITIDEKTKQAAELSVSFNVAIAL